MLPLQITLQGFMSYREKTTLSFEGASLWMLAGENGAGKSSVFDAMRWTLFGAHRGGKSGHEALIHRAETRLRVAFDLELEARRFRLIRTLARAGRSTWQIEEILDGETRKVPETDGRDGYEKWVRDHIGMSDETFCTAMYLAQNRGDAILSANPLQRYEMLAEIVDISAYAALHERAKTRASELESASNAAKNAWQLAAGTNAEEITALGEKLGELNLQIARQNARREEILGLEPLAAQWQNWESERETARSALENARILLPDAPQIERDFARLGELETLLPPLARYVETRARIAKNGEEIAFCTSQSHAALEQEKQLQMRLTALLIELETLETERKNAEDARLRAALESAELAPRLGRARQIGSFRAEIAKLEAELNAFPTHLVFQVSELEARITRAQDEIATRAILRRLAREKAQFRDARAREFDARSAVETLQSALPPAREAARQCVLELKQARQSQKRAIEVLAAATTRHNDAESARARFESVQGESECYFCGQKLTPEHARKEAARLEKAVKSTKNEEESAQIALQNANQAEQNAQSQLESTKNEVINAESALANAIKEQKTARIAAANAFSAATLIFCELRGETQTRLSESPDEIAARTNARQFADFVEAASEIPQKIKVEPETSQVWNALHGDFPDVAELEAPPNHDESLESWRLELQAVAAQETKRSRVVLRLSDRQNQLDSLLGELSGEDFEALFAREKELQKTLETVLKSLKDGETPLIQTREATVRAQRELETARGSIANWKSQIAALEAARIEIERALQSLEIAPLMRFQERDFAALRAELDALQREKTALSGRDLAARLASLREAQERVLELESEVTRLEKVLQSVPEPARRAPQELQLEVAALKKDLDVDFAAQRQLQFERNRLEERRVTKNRLENEHLQAQNRARQHKTLADLLGPHELQRFLLREAENGIIDEANATLDRISGGQLRLELRADDEEIAGARKGIPKVLDVAIFRADEIGRGPGMLPAFLSGSQRFRVAVALALGIGRFATRGGGTRLEAIVIDEGFGALDKIGRGEMIDELQMLGEELRRVILVSHQEEFFEAFPNRYLIENNGDTSTARLMVS